ncbi:hypothetical protein FM037_04130 [Shewanella psychropiezotolerans]|uniref:Uncharacterized protein n=1 Tax=Shewanella psychropiezotolerans TaxID=2593655 RepID=A0ABX5WU12_9GAMM|nr:hypothetical protein [Shewanella psychropiezotolerans]QDO82574.1 hypothetical protein FM037_04130 [Shewanella psychropiezotolerans]
MGNVLKASGTLKTLEVRLTLYEIKNQRLAEPFQNKECTILAGEALGYNEGATFKLHSIKLSQKLNKK